MVIFDNNTKQFSVVEDQHEYALPGYGSSMAIGGVANAVIRQRQRNRLKDKLIAQGKTPQEADRLAKERYGGVAKNTAKGVLKGAGVRAGLGAASSIANKTGITKGVSSAAKGIGKTVKSLFKK